MELHSRYHRIELNLEEKRKGERYKARILLRRNDVDDRCQSIATCHKLAEFRLVVPMGLRDGTAEPAYGILLEKLGILHFAIDDIRAMAQEGRRDGKHVHSVDGSFGST